MKKYFQTKICLAVCFLFLFDTLASPQVVNAASEDFSDVINEAPVGLDISKYFDVGKFELNDSEDSTAYPYQTNSSSVYENASDTSDTKNGKVLVLAKGNSGVTGAAWSNLDSDNYIDITKKQTVSVWLYFGSGDGDDPQQNGEGISLVLQNDARGTSAMGSGYQGLGVLGFDQSEVKSNKTLLSSSWSPDPTTNSKINTPDNAAKMAVNNSIALDFNSQSNSLISKLWEPILVGHTAASGLVVSSRYDEYTLNSYGTAKDSVALPTDYPEYSSIISNTTLGEHNLRLGNSADPYGVISLTYPGKAVTYHQLDLDSLRGDSLLNPNGDASNPWTFINTGKNGKALSTYQVGAKNASLIDGTDADGNPIYWHHLTFTWTPKTSTSPATITYKFNDKMPDGSINNGQGSSYNEISETIPVDVSAFGNPTDNKIYWGLTGSNNTDSNVYSKLAVFESIPALATGTAETTIYDVSDDNKAITDSSTDNTVYNGDSLNFDYNLAWDDTSRQNWQSIAADLNLPSDVDYKSATITYHGTNGDSTVETIAKSSDLSNNEFKYKLAHDLGTKNSNSDYTSADIVVNGTADNQTNSAITVDAEPASFDGSNAIETTSTPKFVIDGQNVVNKILDLEVSLKLNFQSINYGSTKKILGRTNDFDVSVTSLKNPWVLRASTTGLYNGSQPFYGNLIYKDSATSDPIVLSSTPQTIDEDLTSHTTKTVDDISDDWTSNSGLLLENDTSKENKAGQYTGTLNWTAINSL